MPIVINDSSVDTSTGSIRRTLPNVTMAFTGESAELPDSDGSISRTLENVRCRFQTDGPMDGWPFVYTTFSLGNIVDRTTVDPAKTIIANSNFTIHQALFMESSNSRAETRARLQALLDINPDLNIIYHIDWHQIELDIQSTIKAERWLEAQVLANPSDQDNYLLRESSSGPFTCRNSFPTTFGFRWFTTDTVRRRVARGQIAEWSDNDGPSGSLNAGIPIHWMQDTMPEVDNRYANATHSGTITGSISSTQILIPTWPGGGPGSVTYYFKAIESNGTSWDYATVVSVDIGYAPGNDLVTLNRSLENMSVSNGDIFVITSSNAEEGRTQAGELTREQFRQGVVDMGTEIANTIKTEYGLDIDPHCNGANFNWVAKIGGSAPTYPSNFVNYWGGIHCNDDSASGYPCVWLNALTLRNSSDQNIYSWAIGQPVTAAYARFWYLFAWCFDNVAPQVEHESHDVPAWIDEVIIEAGSPVTTRGFGTYDPEGNGGVTGTLSQMTPDFGTWGYVKWFENCCIVINLRDPGDITWVPSHLGGQSINPSLDVWTVADVPAGKKLVHFDRRTYVNPKSFGKFAGRRPTDYDDLGIMRDNLLNNAANGPQTGGGYANGDTVDCGPLESMVLLIVDA